ncbi:Murein L,D-transpeptidase YcbB/YkuD [Paracoccus aminovorans]|uniref:Murein L,D-transpeptidase YcbB/YkuD n=1 Tax=Paracoccus aminovorans TaxID=34004 RepID=A0A1I3BSX5_9RHOB|nr:L,D-transpeptidase family protein [Paracoccus aminovorans]CQR86202.1 peptidoglycan-binding protein [Paracoccus aminovorans]SFH65397.1 Murein L,D-transpeptidase YcbB/YkuD [Paracoccus aminovorans]
MYAARLIRALVVSGLLAAMPWPAAAQALEAVPVAALPAPRLSFSEPEMQLARKVAAHPALADFYGTNGLRPIFLGAEGEARRAALIEAVGQAGSYGLPAARYRQAALRGMDGTGADSIDEELQFARVFADWSHDITGGVLDPRKVESGIRREVQRPRTGDLLRRFAAAADPAAVLADLPSRDPRYQALRDALARQARFVVPADMPLVTEGLWREGASDPAVAALRLRLATIGFAAAPTGSPLLFDAPLAEAVAGFQQAVGLPADGVAGPRTVARLNRGTGPEADAILVALERMRWMNGHDLNARHVWVNLPEFNARIYDGGREIFETRVVIGKANQEFETPEFSETMKYMVVNPRWNVPRSITVKEYLPRLQANRNAVSHLDVVDGAGNVIARDRIDFRKYSAKTFPYRMRQKPSDDNALGQVKFMFPNPWNIYLHDTPTKHLFNQSSRAYSHGCIRIGRPIDLAHELLRPQVANPDAVFSKALASGRETYLNLRPPVPVHLVYFTAFPDETGQIRRFPDIYGRDALVHAALVKAGLDSVAPGE